MILSLHLATSNLPPKGMNVSDAQYPWCVELGTVLFDLTGRDRAIFGSRIRADGRTINPAASAAHGISSREANKGGIPEKTALSLICNLAAEATILTGYNVHFAREVLVSAIIRLGQDPKKLARPGLEIMDLMLPATAGCKLPSEAADGGYKFPRLGDALTILRNERAVKGRDALSAALACKRLFLSLKARGYLDIGEAA